MQQQRQTDSILQGGRAWCPVQQLQAPPHLDLAHCLPPPPPPPPPPIHGAKQATAATTLAGTSPAIVWGQAATAAQQGVAPVFS